VAVVSVSNRGHLLVVPKLSVPVANVSVMSTRLVNIVVATADLRRLAGFWSALLGWPIAVDLPNEVDVRAPESQGWLLDLVFDPVAQPKTVKNRVHLDLASSSAANQAEIITRALDLGATSVDIGQEDVPWEVLADPEGNEFCVLEPREIYQDAGALAAVVVETADPVATAAFWREATGWRTGADKDGAVGLRAPNGLGPWLEFVPEHGPKTVQHRVHVDVAPYADDDHAAEVARLRAAGARPIDIGQKDVPWEVMADPDGNEFCVLTPR
jgi:catechol 2,3-dioxygenase-like lactoylglutathione lyase family enzyme